MTLTDELKIFDNKIKANQAQYNLGREAAKMSALYSKDLVEKYEYLAGEDLGHRPIVLEETKFEYSPLGMILGKSFKKDNVKNAKRERERERERVILIMTVTINFTNFTKGIMNLKRCH